MKLQLIKGRSYNAKGIKVSRDNPIFETSDTALADKLVKSGYFKVISAESKKTDNGEEIPLEKKTEKQLDKYAAENGIDLTSCKNKTEKLTKIQEALKASSEKDSELNFDDEV